MNCLHSYWNSLACYNALDLNYLIIKPSIFVILGDVWPGNSEAQEGWGVDCAESEGSGQHTSGTDGC